MKKKDQIINRNHSEEKTNNEEELIDENIEKRKNYWRNEYWPKLQKTTDDSESKLEKYLFAVSSGAVGLLFGTMGFLDKPIKIFLLFCSFGAFAISLLLCIVYHIIATSGHKRQFELINDFIHNPNKKEDALCQNVKKLNYLLDNIHIVSFIFIIIGIILFVIYLYNNIKT